MNDLETMKSMLRNSGIWFGEEKKYGNVEITVVDGHSGSYTVMTFKDGSLHSIETEK